MKIKNRLPLQRLIGKIDNDFNISESDWIPRVAAWTIDALSQMQILPMEKKRRKLEVKERVAIFPCNINGTELKVFDKYGCEIPELNNSTSCGCSNSIKSTPQEIAVIDDTNKSGVNYMSVRTIVNSINRNFVLDGNKIELSFDTDEIEVETFETATYFDEYYQCEVPYIYDNGLLLEALAWYVMFKYLSRGSKHQVYSLTSPNQVLNPYMQWNMLRPKAMASVKIAINSNNEGWNNFFYNSTFLPRT
ncbi:MAG: putative tail tubular protein [crAssphage sp. isolate ctcc615]|uniref:Tail tubular protein n=1 Tax=crAssphage sp. isolate ctcc615 TaxID=2989853 RepID=A0A345BP28_9CAUD|nr:MAG: putative tail tubular protein [crAssphage sp. isolate ctcc615]AXF52199.1 MAG: putative tail tubular protein [crAssphage sp. isolate ctcc615]